LDGISVPPLVGPSEVRNSLSRMTCHQKWKAPANAHKAKHGYSLRAVRQQALETATVMFALGLRWPRAEGAWSAAPVAGDTILCDESDASSTAAYGAHFTVSTFAIG